MNTTTLSAFSIAAIGLSLSGISFGRDRGYGKGPAEIARESDYNSEAPSEQRFSIPDGSPPSFARAARKVLRELLGNDLKSFKSICSNDGFFVAEHTWEPDLRDSVSTKLLLKPAHNDNVSAAYWVDQSEYFDRNEIAGGEFKRVFDEFHEIMLGTYAFEASTGMWDEWHERLLGPAISAKVCAGTYVYFYLVKARRGWKVWRMEWACH